MASSSRAHVIAVVGGANSDEAAERVAHECGSALARRGWHLLCGGGGGVMEAACRGYAEARGAGAANAGVSIALLPGGDRSAANPYADVVLATGIGLARNAVIARAASGIIAVGGGAGTLCEIAYGWQMGKPIVAMLRSGGWAADIAGRRIDGRRDDAIPGAADAAEAIEFLAGRLEGAP